MLNRVQLIGHLGADPEIRRTQDGRPIANFTLATSERWNDKATGEKRERTEWHRIVVFSEGLAKVVEQYCKKGSKIYVEGKLATRKWTDQQNVERYTTEVVLQGYDGQLLLLDRAERAPPADESAYGARPSSGGADTRSRTGTQRQPPAAPAGGPAFDDEIPF
jgi:single-strand DNA-binding protein